MTVKREDNVWGKEKQKRKNFLIFEQIPFASISG